MCRICSLRKTPKYLHISRIVIAVLMVIQLGNNPVSVNITIESIPLVFKGTHRKARLVILDAGFPLGLFNFKRRKPFEYVTKNKWFTSLLFDLAKNVGRVDLNTIPNEYQTTPILGDAIVFRFKHLCIKDIFITKILVEILFNLGQFIGHSNDILHDEEYWPNML